MKILFFGDIFGKQGQKAIMSFLPDYKIQNNIDICIANCENLTEGKGVSESDIKEMQKAGIDIFSSGNHLYDRIEGMQFIEKEDKIAKPLNYPKEAPGNSFIKYKKKEITTLLITLCGQSFMHPVDSPFFVFEDFLSNFPDLPKVIIVDFHAESTAEKKTFGYYFDGKITAMIGTHTHIQTADEEILENGTGYITDVGMCGSHNSIIGIKKEIAFKRLITGIPLRHITANEGVQINAVVIDVDENTGRTTGIFRIKEKIYTT